MINAALRCLHFEHPFYLVLCLAQDIGQFAAGFGNVEIIVDSAAKQLVRIHKIVYALVSGGNVSAVVARIMPAAANIAYGQALVKAVDGGNVVAFAVLVLARIFFIKSAAATLEVEHTQNCIRYVVNRFFADCKGV